MPRWMRVLGLSLLLLGASRTPAHAADPATIPMPHFGTIAPAWFDPLAFPLDAAWAAAGLPEHGTVYYSSAKPLGGPPYVWDRFNPESDRYQAWFGAYVIDHFAFAREWTRANPCVDDLRQSIQRLQDLSAADQRAWLGAYGDPAPRADIDPASVLVVPLGNRWFGMVFQMATHTDVGGTIAPFLWYPPYALEAPETTAYADVTYTSWMEFTFDEATQHLIVKFASGVTWQTRDGIGHSSPWSVWQETLSMMHATSFRTSP